MVGRWGRVIVPGNVSGVVQHFRYLLICATCSDHTSSWPFFLSSSAGPPRSYIVLKGLISTHSRFELSRNLKTIDGRAKWRGPNRTNKKVLKSSLQGTKSRIFFIRIRIGWMSVILWEILQKNNPIFSPDCGTQLWRWPITTLMQKWCYPVYEKYYFWKQMTA